MGVLSGTTTITVDLPERTSFIWLNAAPEVRVGQATVTRGQSTAAAEAVSHDDLLLLRLPEPLAGTVTLKLAFGLHLSDKDASGVYRRQVGAEWYAYSDFEPMDARRAFPCFDQPELKLRWTITLRIPAAASAFANTPVASETKDESTGEKVVTFVESKPLPSYLVAFAVGPFEATDVPGPGVPFRIIYPKGQADLAAFAADKTRKYLAAAETYFGPYPFEKLDFLAVPGFGAGAMENPGLITFRSTRLLALPADWTLARHIAYAQTAAHELAHMWFGDLVTMTWWDDLWLNEAFASWAGPKIVDGLHPDWNGAMSTFTTRARATAADAETSARRIRQPVETRDDAGDAFDAITYQKGATVLRMFESWIGETDFRRGVALYLDRHRFGNATSADFLAAVGEAAGTDVATPFGTFLDQAGEPIVTVRLSCPKQGAPALELAQARYTPVGARFEAQTWQIPVCVRWGKGKAEARACTLFRAAQATWTLPGASECPEWLVPNAGAIGYYLVAVEGDAARAAVARAGAKKKLSAAERAGGELDTRMSFLAGQIDAAAALASLPELGKESDPAVLLSALTLAFKLDDEILGGAGAEDRARWAGVLRGAYGKRARKLGWLPRAKDTGDETRLRPWLLALLAGPGEDAKLAAEARTLADKWLVDRASVSAEIAGTVLEVAGRGADRALFDRLVGALAKANDLDRRILIEALSSVRQADLIADALQLTLGDTLPPRDARDLLLGLAGNDAARAAAWSFLQAHFDALVAYFPRESAGRLPRVAQGFCDEQTRKEAATFFTGRIEKHEGGAHELEEVLDEIASCAALRAAQLPSALAYLKKHGGSK